MPKFIERQAPRGFRSYSKKPIFKKLAERVSSQSQQKFSLDQTISLRTALFAHTSTHPGTMDVSGRVGIGPVQEEADVSTRKGRPD